MAAEDRGRTSGEQARFLPLGFGQHRMRQNADGRHKHVDHWHVQCKNAHLGGRLALARILEQTSGQFQREIAFNMYLASASPALRAVLPADDILSGERHAE